MKKLANIAAIITIVVFIIEYLPKIRKKIKLKKPLTKEQR